MMVNLQKSEKLFLPANVVGSQITHKYLVNTYFMDHKNIKNQFPQDGKMQIHKSPKKRNPHSFFVQSKNVH